jgi:hypothetical protein
MTTTEMTFAELAEAFAALPVLAFDWRRSGGPRYEVRVTDNEFGRYYYLLDRRGEDKLYGSSAKTLGATLYWAKSRLGVDEVLYDGGRISTHVL